MAVVCTWTTIHSIDMLLSPHSDLQPNDLAAETPSYFGDFRSLYQESLSNVGDPRILRPKPSWISQRPPIVRVERNMKHGGLFIVEPSGLSTLSSRPAEVIHTDSLKFLHFALDSCCTFTDSAERNLLAGTHAASVRAFRNAEEAFDEAQQYLTQIESHDWRDEIQSVLEELGLRLDKLWIRLMAA